MEIKMKELKKEVIAKLKQKTDKFYICATEEDKERIEKIIKGK